MFEGSPKSKKDYRMSKGSRPFRQRDLTRAIKGAEAAGKVVTAASITAAGEIKVSFDIVAEPRDTWADVMPNGKRV
jgi:hypothetical protein